MKSLTKIILLGSTLFFTSAVAGNVGIGQKIYGTKLKDACGFTGVKFTATHTPAEWKKFYDDGQFEAEIKRMCPKVTEYKEVWTEHLFSFAFEYGKGSGNEPAC